MVEGTIDKRQETRALGVQPAEVIDFFNIQGLDVARISAGIGEFDRVLGGGIVPGSLILLGGEPGIGKSTLLLQLAAALSRPSVIASEAKQSHETQDYHGLRTRDDTNVVLYSSGEESAEQIKMRFDRLGLNAQNIKYLGETDIDIICATIAAKKPALAIIDSIQTATTQDVESPFGSVSQIKAAAAKLMEAAKTSRVPIIIIGHITKDGDIAGPKTLEHMVDAVLYFEGESLSHYRILRAIKNRFGNTNEIGIFEMTQQGLKEIANP